LPHFQQVRDACGLRPHNGYAKKVATLGTHRQRWYQVGIFYLIPIMPQAKLTLVSDALLLGGELARPESAVASGYKVADLCGWVRACTSRFSPRNYSIAIQQNEAILAASSPCR
jgi:hypothetical protein